MARMLAALDDRPLRLSWITDLIAQAETWRTAVRRAARPTLGDDAARGWISPRLALEYERHFGEDWRSRRPEEALAAQPTLTALWDERLAANEERLIICEALAVNSLGENRPVDDAFVAELIDELYGPEPAPAAVDAVWDTVLFWKGFTGAEGSRPARESRRTVGPR